MITDKTGAERIKAMAGDGRKIAYLSGPITCCPGYEEIFRKAQYYLESRGYIVLNPAVLPAGMPHARYLPINDAMIDASDEVFLLDGWEDSTGCAHEIQHTKVEDKELHLLPKEAYR